MDDNLTQLSVCVINYNGRDYLPACMDAIQQHVAGCREVIVIDDASVDGSAELIDQQYPQATLKRLEQNSGPGAARNAGFAAATGQYVLFVDNDVQLAPGAARALLRALLDTTDATVAMPRVCYADRPNIIQYDGAGCHPVGLMTLHNERVPVGEAGTESRSLGSVVTACIVVRKSAFGPDPFDASFFFNYEDHDFGLRCRIAGHVILSVSAAMCYHGAGTEGLSYRRGGQYSKQRAYYLIRNRWQILLKNYQLRTLLILLPILLLYEVAQVGGALARGWLWQWLKSFAWILAHLPQIARKRRAVQRSRKQSDLELFETAPLPLTDELRGNPAAQRTIAMLDRAISGYWKWVRPAHPRESGSPD